MQEVKGVSSNKYLTFRLEEDIFAVDVGKVVRILDPEKITKIPRTPDFMKGVMNLRGKVLPIIDLRLMLGLERTEVSRDTCIIVFEVAFEEEKIELGSLADSVQAVKELAGKEIEPPPNIGIELDTEFIEGIGKSGEEFIIILNINRVFSVGALKLIKQERQKLGEAVPVPEEVGATAE